MDSTEPGKGAGKSASLGVPRAAMEALLDAKATAREICTYLILAKFTEGTGVYSTASVKAGYGNQSPSGFIHAS